MAMYADRVQETSTTSGTGNIILDGAIPSFRSFVAAFGSSSVVVPYCLVDGTSWEVGEGTFNGTNGITRSVLSSSNANTLISLSGGVTSVFCTIPAAVIQNLVLNAPSTGAAVINFGDFPGSNEASVWVGSQITIQATSIARAFFVGGGSTSDHTVEDHTYGNLLISLTCDAPIVNDGFYINARCLEQMQGTFQIHWEWK